MVNVLLDKLKQQDGVELLTKADIDRIIENIKKEKRMAQD